MKMLNYSINSCTFLSQEQLNIDFMLFENNLFFKWDLYIIYFISHLK